MRIDSESESEDGLSSVSVEMVGRELDREGSCVFLLSSAFVAMSRGNGGTGGRLWEASICGGGGAKGGSFNEIGTLRTCRKMAEACAGQMAKNTFHRPFAMSLSTERAKWNAWNARRTCGSDIYKSGFKHRVIQ